MRLIPETRGGKIRFFRARATRWAQVAEQVGVSEEAVEILAARVAAAQEALIAQLRAMSAAQSATLRLKMEIEALMDQGSKMIQQIRMRARTSGEQEDAVLHLAWIPPVKKASPVGELGTPYAFKVELQQSGPLVLRWKCRHPRSAVGTMYHVWRRIGLNGEAKFLGATGVKKLIDVSIPPGTAKVVYAVQAVRSNAKGDWGYYPVNFTVTPGSPELRQHPAPGPDALAA